MLKSEFHYSLLASHSKIPETNITPVDSSRISYYYGGVSDLFFLPPPSSPPMPLCCLRYTTSFIPFHFVWLSLLPFIIFAFHFFLCSSCSILIWIVLRQSPVLIPSLLLFNFPYHLSTITIFVTRRTKSNNEINISTRRRESWGMLDLKNILRAFEPLSNFDLGTFREILGS